MNKRITAILIVLALVAAMFAGCASTSPEGADSDSQGTVGANAAGTGEFEFADTNKDGKVVVGFSAFTFSDAWMVSSDEALRALCAEYGYEYTSQGAESNSATQVGQIENMITMGCDWIYATIFDPDALEDTCKKAEENNCHIIFLGDAYEDRDAFYAAISGSQYDYGYLSAVAASAWIDEKYPDAAEDSIEAAIFKNTTTEDFQSRADGMAYIEVLNPKVKIVEIYDLVGQDAATAKCQEYTDQLFVEHPDCKLILSHSSDFAIAIDEDIMRTATLDPSTIGIFSDDWLLAAGQSVRESADNNSTLRGFVASGDVNATVLKIVRGEILPDDEGYISSEMFTFTVDNIDDAFAMFGEA